MPAGRKATVPNLELHSEHLSARPEHAARGAQLKVSKDHEEVGSAWSQPVASEPQWGENVQTQKWLAVSLAWQLLVLAAFLR